MAKKSSASDQRLLEQLSRTEPQAGHDGPDSMGRAWAPGTNGPIVHGGKMITQVFANGVVKKVPFEWD